MAGVVLQRAAPRRARARASRPRRRWSRASGYLPRVTCPRSTSVRNVTLPASLHRAKPRRRSELGLLLVGGVTVLFATLLESLAMTQRAPSPPDHLHRRPGPHRGRRPDREPLARAPRRPRDHADRPPAERHRLRDDRAPRSARGWSAARLDRARPGHLRRSPVRGEALARPRALPLPHRPDRVPASRRAAPAGHRTLHQRRAPVGPLPLDRVPAHRDRKDPARHLLRVVLHRKARAAHDPDAPCRRPSPPGPARLRTDRRRGGDGAC